MDAPIAAAEAEYALMVALYAGAVGTLVIASLLVWAVSLTLARK